MEVDEGRGGEGASWETGPVAATAEDLNSHPGIRIVEGEDQLPQCARMHRHTTQNK